MESAAASVFVESVMGRLFTLLEEEHSKHRDLVLETQSMKRDFGMIAAAVDDHLRSLGRCGGRTAVARLFSEEMLDLAHDIEDCVDRFMHRLNCKHLGCAAAGGGPGSSLTQRVFHKLKKVGSRSCFADEIQKLQRRLRESHQRVMNAVNIASGGQPDGSSSTTKPRPRVTRNPVGLEKPVEDVLSLLDDMDGEQGQLRVISIVGFGGLGKTTLSRAVYDSHRVQERFDCRAWVAAAGGSPESSRRMRVILRDILQQVRSTDTMDLDVSSQHLEALLKECLKDKRYLIVIDEIQKDEWSALISALEDNSRSCRIIVTTAIQSVANNCSHGNGYVYQMNTLGEEESKKIAFPAGVRSPELEQGSVTLLRKCDGLPLALVSISDYLKSSIEPTGELCAELCRNLGSHLKEKHGHDNFSDLRKVLVDNYDSLCGNALTCLLYLGIFPNNRPLRRNVLIRRWLAEGYARSDPLRSEEDNANENFKKLVDQNIIQPIDRRNNSQVKTFKAHGIMHEFVLHKSLSQGFVTRLPREHARFSVNAHNARHLSIHASKLTECMASDEELSRVRSLTVFGDAGAAISYVRKCKLTRVLDLEECGDLDDDHLKDICKLWHLKYLSAGGSITKLPKCIEHLHCLETLDFKRTSTTILLVEAILLPHLARLFGKFVLDKNVLDNPITKEKLVKFLSTKSNLQTLAGFITQEGNGFLQLMGHMNKLRKVKVWCKHATSSGDLSQAIQKFSKIPIERESDRSLSIHSEEPSENFLDSLGVDPCPAGFKYDLRVVKLHCKLSKLPPFVTLLSGLTELCLSSDTLTQDIISAVANLNRLLYLKLIADKLEDIQIKRGNFPSLRRLCFVVQILSRDLPLTIEQGALEKVVSLQLLCQGLDGLSGIDIGHFKNLKEITVHAGATAETRQDWEQAAKKHPNRPRVLFLKMADPMASNEPGPCAEMENRKRPSSDHIPECSLKKTRRSEPPFFEVSSEHPSSVGMEVNVNLQCCSSSVPSGT